MLCDLHFYPITTNNILRDFLYIKHLSRGKPLSPLHTCTNDQKKRTLIGLVIYQETIGAKICCE